MVTGEVGRLMLLDRAKSRVRKLVDEHRQREMTSGWDDYKDALCELGYVGQIVDRVAESATTADEFLATLEGVLDDRLSNYESDAEYGSDVGRLGSFVSDLKQLRKNGISL